MIYGLGHGISPIQSESSVQSPIDLTIILLLILPHIDRKKCIRWEEIKNKCHNLCSSAVKYICLFAIFVQPVCIPEIYCVQAQTTKILNKFAAYVWLKISLRYPSILSLMDNLFCSCSKVVFYPRNHSTMIDFKSCFSNVMLEREKRCQKCDTKCTHDSRTCSLGWPMLYGIHIHY